MLNSIISLYDNQFHSVNGKEIDINWVLDDIKNGRYKSKVLEIRLSKQNFKLEKERCGGFTKDELKLDEKYQKAKSKLEELKGKIPRITVSGLFKKEGRKECNLASHSGFIDIDIDGFSEEDLIVTKQILSLDRYCYSCFVTCGGDGLSFIAKINSSRHSDSFEGFANYFFKTYGLLLPIDGSHKNVANTRNVSFDEDLYINIESDIFKDYPKKQKEQKILKFVYAKNDFERIVRDIEDKGIDFCDTYEIYRDVGFAIASKFGASGFDYFNRVCQYGQKYDYKKIQKDYKYFCRGRDGISIGTFYWRCADFGIETYSKETKLIGSIATSSRKTGKTKEDTIKNIVAHEGIDKEKVEPIVNQVFDDKIDIASEDGLLNDIENYIKHNYSLKKNFITGMIENDEKIFTEEDLNSLYVDVKKVFEKADQRWTERIIFSKSTKEYNPILDFFQNNLDRVPFLFDKNDIAPIVMELWKGVKTDDFEYMVKFGTKWLVSVVASAHGFKSDLELVFTGKRHAGKTYFFEHILPKELQRYFAESKLDSNDRKDDYLLMCICLIILQNECAGKSRADDREHKNLLDKSEFNIRPPYKKSHEIKRRLSVLCGTSNENDIVTDSHNRRTIPVVVNGRDNYDHINKTDLWMALYQMYINGFDWRIREDEIEELNKKSARSYSYSMEYEFIKKFFKKGAFEYTISEIKVFLDNKTNQKTNMKVLNAEMQRIGFETQMTEDGRKVFLMENFTGEIVSEHNIF